MGENSRLAWDRRRRVKIIGKRSDYVEDAIEVQLSQGMIAHVSPEDADIDHGNWHVSGGTKSKCAARRRTAQEQGHEPYQRGYKPETKPILMHRIILERMIGRPLADGEECDHINGDPFDNRRCNLRVATRSENNRNRRGWGKHGRGVRYDKQKGKYIAMLSIGSFDTPEEATRAWEDAARKVRGDDWMTRELD